MVVKLFLNDVQISNANEGVEHLRSIVQHLFWVLGLRSELHRIRLKCVFCAKRAPMISASMISALMMSDLPSEKLGFGSAPFALTGIDFFGPFEVKIARSSHKRWCCPFTCLTVRAIHIEVCHSLSTDSCLLVLWSAVECQSPSVLIKVQILLGLLMRSSLSSKCFPKLT